MTIRNYTCSCRYDKFGRHICAGCQGFIRTVVDANTILIKDPERCKHDVHGTDCFECYPAEDKKNTEMVAIIPECLNCGSSEVIGIPEKLPMYSESQLDEAVVSAVKAERERCYVLARNPKLDWRSVHHTSHNAVVKAFSDLEWAILTPKEGEGG